MGRPTSNHVLATKALVLRRKQSKAYTRPPRLRRGYRDLCLLNESEWFELREALEAGKDAENLVEVLTCPPEDTLPQHHGRITDGFYKRLKQP